MNYLFLFFSTESLRVYKWINSDDIQYGVNLLRLGCCQIYYINTTKSRAIYLNIYHFSKKLRVWNSYRCISDILYRFLLFLLFDWYYIFSRSCTLEFIVYCILLYIFDQILHIICYYIFFERNKIRFFLNERKLHKLFLIKCQILRYFFI